MSGQNSRGNGFAIAISAAVVILLVLVGLLVVWLNSGGSDTGAPDDPAEVSSGVLTVGGGPADVEIWFDYACPHCQQFEMIYGEAVGELVDDGEITLRLHPVALPSLNAASGTEFSARAGGALLCVAEHSATAALEFHEELFELRPSGPGLDDDALSELAADAGAPAASDCIAAATHLETVVAHTSQLPRDANGGAGTPTLVIDGEYISITGSVEADLLDRVG